MTWLICEVTNEESPAVALSMVGEAEEESKYYDLVITDMDLMELDHFRFFNHIILNTQLPIILMSCDENSDVLRKALNQAVCFFLRKPIRSRVLASVWQHVFRVRRMQTMHNMNGQGKQILQENDICEENNIEINGESPQVQSKIHATDEQNLSNDDARLVTNQEKEDCLRKSDEEDEHKNDIEDERLNKKPRMSWTDELRLQFEKAIKILGEESTCLLPTI
ncbi:two-component response regulator ORR23-like [Primulina huaijiensis]|uniref:two-component response regulator ORR23-like n=1 Tax=Primulina huaijiensis TaxID=1492673 RepID=UPI003CC6F2CC